MPGPSSGGSPAVDTGPRALLVDADPSARAGWAAALSTLGRRPAFEARTVVGAREILAAEPVGCVLARVEGPADGVLRVTREAEVPLVAVVSDPDTAAEVLAAGALDVLVEGEYGPVDLVRAMARAGAEGELAQLRRELEHSDRLASLGQLAASVAHEINNPAAFVAANLVSLRGWCVGLSEVAERNEELARAMREVVALEDALSVIDESVDGLDRIARIVRQMRGFARRPDRDEAIEWVDMSDVADWAIALTSNRVSAVARFERELADALPRFPGRPGRLAQVATNLIVNAAQAIGAGGPGAHRVRLTTAVREGVAILAVEDSGPGMSDEIKAHALTPFFTTKPAGDGTGLGLAIVLEIVQAHGGTLSLLDSELGGLRVEVRIPLDNGLEAPRISRMPTPAPRDEGSLRILLIDDEPSLRRAYTRLLMPHEVLALDARGAQARLTEQRDTFFDVVICDLMMPDLDGPALYQVIEERAPALTSRVIFCTGGVFDARTREFLAKITNPVLEKPVSRDALIETALLVSRG